MFKTFRKIILLTSVFVTSACSNSIKEKLGLHNNAPDEFKVVANTPLTVPPDFTLRPPMPGVNRPQEVDLRQQAKETLFERQLKNNNAGTSKSEDAFLKRAKISEADSGIKETLTQDEQKARAAEEAKKKQGLFEKIASFFGFDSQPGAKQQISDTPKTLESNSQNNPTPKPQNDKNTPAATEKGGLINNVFGF
jgi:hypothetical protein